MYLRMKGAMTTTPSASQDAESDPSLASDPKLQMSLAYIGNGEETAQGTMYIRLADYEENHFFAFVNGAVPPV
jgi:hypothetical protein